jgi:TPP-dependent pyruvate/acetoin dehydrogenase alpha subunit
LHRLFHNSVENNPHAAKESAFQNFSIPELQLAEDMSTKSAKNKSAGSAPSLISDKKLQQLYTTMLKCRVLESQVRSLNGGSFWKGKEGATVAATIDLQPTDGLVFPAGAAVASFLKGVPLRSIFRQSLQRSSTRVKDKRKNIASAGVLAQGALATGIAYAQSTGTGGSVTVAFLSGNPEGCNADRDVLQFARAHKLPIVYIHNGEPADVPQINSHDFPVIPVDGSDVVAVYRVAYECTTRARQGGGPSMIACSFVSKNNATKYQDPLRNMERYLFAKGLDMNERKQSIIRSFKQAIATARKPSHHRKTKGESRNVFIM